MKSKKCKIISVALLVITMMLFITACDRSTTSNDSNDSKNNECNHSWVSATCTVPKTCSKCNETQGDAPGHTWVNATCTVPKTCFKCNETTGDALGHTMISSFCTKCNYTSLKIEDVLSAPIKDVNKLYALSGDQYHWSNGDNFRIGYNSADGLYLMWAAKNLASKEIKYLTFTVEFFNAVDDPAYDQITNKASTTIRLIGPIESKDSFLYRKLIGYNGACSYIVITDITIEYTDGTKVSGIYNYSTKGISRYDFSKIPQIFTYDSVG